MELDRQTEEHKEKVRAKAAELDLSEAEAEQMLKKEAELAVVDCEDELAESCASICQTIVPCTGDRYTPAFRTVEDRYYAEICERWENDPTYFLFCRDITTCKPYLQCEAPKPVLKYPVMPVNCEIPACVAIPAYPKGLCFEYPKTASVIEDSTGILKGCREIVDCVDNGSKYSGCKMDTIDEFKAENGGASFNVSRECECRIPLVIEARKESEEESRENGDATKGKDVTEQGTTKSKAGWNIEAILATPEKAVLVLGLCGAVLLFLMSKASARRSGIPAQHGMIIKTMISVIDMATDILFVVSAYKMGSHLFPYALTFSVLPLLTNLWAVVYLIRIELKNRRFHKWLGDHALPFAFFSALSVTNGDILNLLHSNIFGAEIFMCPFTPVTLNRLKIVGMISTLLEDIPQAVIQTIAASANGLDDVLLVSLGITYTKLFLDFCSKLILICWILTGEDEEEQSEESETGEGANELTGLLAYHSDKEGIWTSDEDVGASPTMTNTVDEDPYGEEDSVDALTQEGTVTVDTEEGRLMLDVHSDSALDSLNSEDIAMHRESRLDEALDDLSSADIKLHRESRMQEVGEGTEELPSELEQEILDHFEEVVERGVTPDQDVSDSDGVTPDQDAGTEPEEASNSEAEDSEGDEWSIDAESGDDDVNKSESSPSKERDSS